MDRLIVTMLWVSLAAGVCEAAGASAPGYSVRISRAGIDVFIADVTEASEPYSLKLPVPDVDSTVSGVDLRLSGMRISKFERPRITYTLQEPNKILVKVNFPRIVITGAVSPASNSPRTACKRRAA